MRTSAANHLGIFLKSACLAASSLLAFAAIKHLALTVAGGIRASGPIWPLFGGIVFFGEIPNGHEQVGLLLILGALAVYTFVGLNGQQHKTSSSWIAVMVGAVLLAGCSLLLDKALVSRNGIDPRQVQFLSDVYRFGIIAFATVLLPEGRTNPPRAAHWHWGIVFGGIGMSLGEYIYFHALLDPLALIGVLSALRRVSVITAFLFAITLQKEDQIRMKGAAISILIVGLSILAVSPRAKNTSPVSSQTLQAEPKVPCKESLASLAPCVEDQRSKERESTP